MLQIQNFDLKIGHVTHVMHDLSNCQCSPCVRKGCAGQPPGHGRAGEAQPATLWRRCARRVFPGGQCGVCGGGGVRVWGGGRGRGAAKPGQAEPPTVAGLRAAKGAAAVWAMTTWTGRPRGCHDIHPAGGRHCQANSVAADYPPPGH